MGRGRAHPTVAIVKSPWVAAGPKTLRCEDHPDVKAWPRVPKKGATSGCPKCPPPGAMPVEDVTSSSAPEAVVVTPAGCRSLAQREARLTEIADHAWNQARGIAKDGKKSRISQNIALKWAAEATKAERGAAELGYPRERRKNVEETERLGRVIERGLKGRGGAN